MDSIWLTLALPLLGSLICATHFRALGRTATGLVACLAILGSFLASLHQVKLLHELGPHSYVLAPWLNLPDVGSIDIGAFVDPLTVTMLGVVTGVAFLIHCFSMGYMEDEPEYGRFFASLNLFVATMVLLVLANNLALLLVGWGGVGYASYSLIGFYRNKPSAVAAARKAFLYNVVGDVGMMLAIFLLARGVHTVDIQAFSQAGRLEALGPGAVSWICMLLLVAAYAKSAQLPLHGWLPDAMEGPTPVSALIHAATMVTAGVYLLVRCHALFDAAPDIAEMIALLGALTALAAAGCAMVQNDLKRILAYSTMSQLGYMFMACGVGAYGAAVFHLAAHAFFKALLFLTAGVVIHAQHGEQDITRMGGLGRRMPAAQLAFLFGSLALAGLPPLAGIPGVADGSKGAILAATWSAAHPQHLLLWGVGIVTALMTAYYTGRAYLLVFWAPPQHGDRPLHQPGSSMLWPLALLATLALTSGFAGSSLEAALEPTVKKGPAVSFAALGHAAPKPEEPAPWLETVAVLVALAGVGAAWSLHRGGRSSVVPDTWTPAFRGPEAVDQLFLLGGGQARRAADLTAERLDRVPSELAPDLAARGLQGLSGVLCGLQNGSLRLYALAVLAGSGLLAVFVFVLQVLGQKGTPQ